MCSEFLGDFHNVSQTTNLEVKKTEPSASFQNLCAIFSFSKLPKFEVYSTHNIKSI